MRRRVVVTGVGCVTPLGTTVPELWANLKEAKSGVGPTTLFDANIFWPVRHTLAFSDAILLPGALLAPAPLRNVRLRRFDQSQRRARA